jgi:putative acetyltransferase
MMQQYYQEFFIRDWQKSDRDLAAAVIHQVLVEYGLPWQPKLADRDVIEVEAFYLDRGGEFWVVELEGKIVGTAAYYPVEHDRLGVEIRKMYLLAEFRRRGLGKYLLEQLEKAIANRDFTTIYIETASVLKEAVILYEKNNYQPMTEVATARCDLAYYKKLH